MDASREFVELITGCRTTCLWFLAPDKLPAEREAQIYALDCVERYGNREDFIQARRLKQWLSQHSNKAFVVS
jgi:hypothetical protein